MTEPATYHILNEQWKILSIILLGEMDIDTNDAYAEFNLIVTGYPNWTGISPSFTTSHKM